MTWTRTKFVYGVLATVAAALVVYGTVFAIRYFTNPYRGLVTYREVQMSDALRTLERQKLATEEAGLAAQLAAGEKIDMDAYLAIAHDARLLGDLVTARQNLEKLLALNPQHLVGWGDYAVVLEDMHDFALAEDAYKQALKIGDTEGNAIAYIQFLDRNFATTRSDDLLAAYDSAVAKFGQAPVLMLGLARLYRDRGDCENSLAHYEVVRTLAPDDKTSASEYEAERDVCKK